MHLHQKGQLDALFIIFLLYFVLMHFPEIFDK